MSQDPDSKSWRLPEASPQRRFSRRLPEASPQRRFSRSRRVGELYLIKMPHEKENDQTLVIGRIRRRMSRRIEITRKILYAPDDGPFASERIERRSLKRLGFYRQNPEASGICQAIWTGSSESAELSSS